MTDKEIEKIDLGKYRTNNKKGLILEVDLEYPQELHTYTTTIPWLQKRLKHPVICYPIIARKSLINLKYRLG